MEVSEDKHGARNDSKLERALCTDGLSIPWNRGDVLRLCPPFALMAEALRKFREDRPRLGNLTCLGVWAAQHW